MATIAARHGIRDWRGLYEHPDNTPLRAACPDPNLLVPGTEVFVPDQPPPHPFEVATGEEHTFVLRGSADRLRLCLCAPKGERRRGWLYRLEVGDETLEGVVAEDGILVAALPPEVTAARLSAWPSDGQPPEEPIELRIGGLLPADHPEGVQARLANLGHYRGDLDGDLDSGLSRAALRAFGSEDPDRIAKKHGC